MLALIFFYGEFPSSTKTLGILTGGTMMFLLGVADDRYTISPYIKLLGQFIAALTTFYLGVQITALDLPQSQLLLLGAFSMPVTVLWLVGIANAMNFIDGVDGLAGGVALISSVTMAVVALFTHQSGAGVMSAVLCGSLAGFLVYNFFPARIFMGDGGSLFCGFILAAVAVTGVLKTQIAVVLVPVLVLSVPILDIVYSTLRRLLTGRNPFIADAGHIHHRLLNAGMSHVRIAGTLYSVGIVAGMLTTIYLDCLWLYLLLVTGAGLLVLALLTLRFSSNTEEWHQLRDSIWQHRQKADDTG